jgi:putative transposase
MSKRKFITEDKLKLIKEASEQGVTKTLAKYDVYPATYYSWRRKLQE